MVIRNLLIIRQLVFFYNIKIIISAIFLNNNDSDNDSDNDSIESYRKVNNKEKVKKMLEEVVIEFLGW